jgi:signal transduction histidine kinase/CheY-like chemotaxis protein
VLSGPLDLVQGGEGFIVRTPIFVEEAGGRRHFHGIVSTVIGAEGLYRASGLSDPGLTLDVALSGRDGVVGDGPPFFGDPAVLAGDPVTARVELPSGAWQLAAVPRGGWTAPPQPWGTRALFAVAGLLIAVPILGAAQLVAVRQGRMALVREREAELSRLSWRLEFALAASEIGVWDVDLATDELFWDERTKEIFGRVGAEGPFSEPDWLAVLHPDDRARALGAAEAAVHGDGRYAVDYRALLPDGTVRHVRDMARRYEGRDGARRLVGLVWDMTPDVERQEELNLRRLEAEAATKAKSRFLAAMSHEIRTPMSGVLGLLGLMLDDPLPDRQKERATIALASAQSLLQILNDILDFSKLEAKQIKISEESVDVRQLIDEVMELMATPAEQKGLGLGAEVDAGVPERLHLDPMRVRQVLTNLLSNATKFTDQGEVRVRVSYLPGSAAGNEAQNGAGLLAVEVEDTGIGIAEVQAEHIFQDFVQADDSLSRRSGGTGLGLAICRQLVELMGGEVGVRSVPGMGSTFRFTVRAEPAPSTAAEPAGRDGRGRRLPPMRVLLAEDHATNQYLISAYLAAAGHEVVLVQNGAEAVEAAARGGLDVVLMDVQMPEVDGHEATRRIRALPGPVGRVPIVALTANALPSDQEACIAAGKDGYLSKPVDVLALHEALRRFAAEPPRRPVAVA